MARRTASTTTRRPRWADPRTSAAGQCGTRSLRTINTASMAPLWFGKGGMTNRWPLPDCRASEAAGIAKPWAPTAAWGSLSGDGGIVGMTLEH